MLEDRARLEFEGRYLYLRLGLGAGPLLLLLWGGSGVVRAAAEQLLGLGAVCGVTFYLLRRQRGVLLRAQLWLRLVEIGLVGLAALRLGVPMSPSYGGAVSLIMVLAGTVTHGVVGLVVTAGLAGVVTLLTESVLVVGRGGIAGGGVLLLASAYTALYALSGGAVLFVAARAAEARSAAEQAKHAEEARRRQAEAEALLEIGRVLVGTLEEAEVLERIVESACELVDVEGSELLLSETDGSFRVAASSDRGSARVGAIVPETSVAGEAARRGRALIANELSPLPEYYDRSRSEGVLRTLAVAPLVSRSEVVGVISAINRRRGEFDGHDLRLLSVLAAHAATAISTARLHERVLASEARYRRLVAMAPDAVFALDTEGRFVETNPAAAQILGYDPPESMLGRVWCERLAPGEYGRAEHLFGRLLLGQRAAGEVDFVDRGGRRRRISVHAAPVVEEGEVVGVQGVARDVTADRERQERIRIFASALENLREAVLVVGTDERIIYANEVTAAITGYGVSELIEQPLTMLVPETAEARAALREIVMETYVDGGWRGERGMRRQDGTLVPMELITGLVFDERGRPRGLFAIGQDLTAEKRREEQLRRSERLASLGRLLAGVAHELNNPLTGIRAYAQLLRGDDLAAESQEMVQQIDREAARAARVVRDLLAFSRERGGERRPVEVSGLLEAVAESRRYALKTNGIRLETEVAPDTGAVAGDRHQLEQVLLNLVVNAEAALRGVESPRIVLRARPAAGPVREGAAAAGSGAPAGVQLEVEDNGCGIAAEVLPRIFDPFFTTRAEGEGTGLGLSLVHGIVETHGGSVTVESEEGSWTRVAAWFPAADGGAESVAEPGEVHAEPPQSTLRVLVVDDEAAIRSSVVRFLRRRGHDVDAVSDGEQALHRVAAQRYDAILCDLRMPGLDGESFFGRVRDSYPGIEERIIFMTGDSASGRTREFLDRSGCRVVDKPFELQELAHLIEAPAGGARP